MKIVLEVSDFDELFESTTYDGEYAQITGLDIKESIMNMLLERMVESVYSNYMGKNTMSVYGELKTLINNTIMKRQDEIIEKVVEKTTEEILRKKSIVNEMPKKCEITNINKEWENYFIELIDKAIAKRFK